MEEKKSDAKQFASLHRLFGSLRNGVKFEPEGLDQLRNLFGLSEAALETTNRQRILRGLEFESMDVRFDEVSDASADTFQWIVSDDKSLYSTHPDLEISFKDWLTQGSGIFHISGKPGAGKSTLMKFICAHKQTEPYLRQWSGSKALVFAKFFFWKPGTPLQKSLEGLIRSLLSSILRTSPELVSTLLQEHWQPDQISPWMSQTPLKISRGDVFRAFHRLVDDTSIFESRRFCFFIDGLDEFDDPDERQAGLVERLKKWTALHPNGIKICVSSRELNTFQGNFSVDQRLRLHLLTQDDIKKAVQTKLERHQKFQQENEQDRQKLVDDIVSRAEGVFLWVTLVLNELWDALDDNDSFSDLHDKLDLYPEGLNDVFVRTLDLIHKSDRNKAWAIFAVAMRLSNNEIPGMSLLHYSFLEDYVKDRGFAINEQIRDFTTEQTKARVDEMRVRLNGLCKGLLEITSTNDKPELRSSQCDEKDAAYYAFKDSVVFVHRSVYEFLKEDPPADMANFLTSFHAEQAILHSFLAQVKLIPWHKYASCWMQERLPQFLKEFGGTLIKKKQESFELMHSLDNALIQRQHEEPSNSNEIQWDKFSQAEIPYYFHFNPEERRLTSLLFYAATVGFREYVIWSLDTHPALSTDERTRAEILGCVLSGESGLYNTKGYVRDVSFLRYLLERGFRTDYVSFQDSGFYSIIHASGTRNISVWQKYFMRFTQSGCIEAWQVVKLFLEYGADPHCLIWEDEARESVITELGMVPNLIQVRYYGNDDKVHGCIAAKGGKASLRRIWLNFANLIMLRQSWH